MDRVLRVVGHQPASEGAEFIGPGALTVTLGGRLESARPAPAACPTCAARAEEEQAEERRLRYLSEAPPSGYGPPEDVPLIYDADHVPDSYASALARRARRAEGAAR